MDEQTLVAVAGALVLAAVHVFAGRIKALDRIPRSRWLSAAGGVSVAYVFVHLLPELAEGQAAIEGEGGEGAALLGFLEEHVYLVALLGLVVFYGVENASLRSRRERRQRTGEDRTNDAVFWLSIGSFAIYNAVVGYLLLSEELDEVTQLVLYTIALAVHFVINDVGLREHHKDAYHRVGRWLLAAGVLVGCLVGLTGHVSERALALVIAFLGGGIVLNVLKEELPGERQAIVLPFVLGALGYTVLLQLA